MLQNSIAKSTAKTYDYPIELYMDFCKFYKLDTIPPTKQERHIQLERYATYRLQFAKGTESTLPKDIDAIQHWFHSMGYESNVKNEHQPIKKLFKTAKIYFPKKSKATRPLTLDELKRVLKLLNTNYIDDCVIHAVWTFAYATGLRVHEFLAEKNSNVSEFRKLFYLRRDRISIWQDSKSRKHFAVVWYYHSKNNQNLTKQKVTLPCFCRDGVCAIKSINRLLALTKKLARNTALFTWANGKYVTSSQSALALKNAVTEIGSDAQFIANHSMRKLLITQAVKQGMPESVIVQLVDWKSFNSSRPYIDLEPQDLVQVRQHYYENGKTTINNERFNIQKHNRFH